MMELTNIKQEKGELVIDHINRWRALSLDNKDRHTKLSIVEMCTQGMHWGLLYIMQGIKPNRFEELATSTHYMKLSIANRGIKDFPFPEVRKHKKEANGAKKIVKRTMKKSIVDENLEVIVCHAISATEEENIPLRSLEEKGVPKDLSRLRTTYKLLLDRPWIHRNRVVTSTLHECFKFYQDGVKKVEADSNPFSEVESHFADENFYLKNDNNPEVVPVEISLVRVARLPTQYAYHFGDKTEWGAGNTITQDGIHSFPPLG
ncbi:retrotransposon protein putative ty3-gypsy sub-class [Cucumis melo var. makuwa]|uniref:Retrotransposon protein putative ty3-gypsy sub-class n=1 Tax=Cucumis melo var. makuwa TaxID=1194695 RepID=A0A5A7SJY0_CUCMM|nr:retrotransposon protein putative ty3-gypsy sub-class [Cucumis melo var. makuwa]